MTGYAGISTMQIATWLITSAMLSAVLTWAALAYARRLNLVDLPGQRRSHTAPTPRGGGIGICVAIVVCFVAMGLVSPGAAIAFRLVAAIAIVAIVGWIDDHRSLPIAVRLVAQIASVAIFLWPLVSAAFAEVGAGVFSGAVVALGILLFLGLWSINLHNFMDGIDGILATQSIFVLTVLAWLCVPESNHSHALQIAVCAAAVVGFLPFNFPRARIFMGDVGSGALGLLIFIASIWQVSSAHPADACVLVAVSAFVTDATCTLLSRLFAGKRWYRPHREHLYQWMARAGMSHAAVVAWYAAWNLLIVLPIIYLIRDDTGARAWIEVAALYALAISVWLYGKQWCLQTLKTKNPDA
ncbi:MAG: glycosyltransferase family 4 protein [Rudaea sp.]